MVQEAYCSKEVSELLKKKGFLKGIDLRLISNLSFYTYTGLQYDIAKWYDSLIQDKIDFVLAPTHQIAMDWLREVHRLHIHPDYIDFLEHGEVWVVKIIDMKTFKEYSLEDTESSFEEAVEAALKYALENLI